MVRFRGAVPSFLMYMVLELEVPGSIVPQFQEESGIVQALSWYALTPMVLMLPLFVTVVVDWSARAIVVSKTIATTRVAPTAVFSNAIEVRLNL